MPDLLNKIFEFKLIELEFNAKNYTFFQKVCISKHGLQKLFTAP
jgi:hypothetical protein